MNLSKLQQDIVNAPEKRIAVRASAAAGKTTLLISKIRKLLADGEDANQIAVITFTRHAAVELIERLGDDYKDGIFVGTIHALAASFLIKQQKVESVKAVINEEKFDKLFELCKNLNLYHTYKWVLIDECQDTGEKELSFIFEKIDPECFFVAFDTRQSIYQWRDARPDILLNYMEEKEATYYNLNENYRNGKYILDYARAIISRTGENDDSIAMSKKNGYIGTFELFTDDLLDMIFLNDSYKDWAILCRTNKQVEDMAVFLTKHKIPYCSFKQGNLTKVELDKLMKEDSLKLLTCHSAKGLEWNNVIVYGSRWGSDEEIRLNYVAATRAKERLIWLTRIYPKVRKQQRIIWR